MKEMRAGHGFDVHRLQEGRPLLLLGVLVPYDKGLQGHSDADVAAHAVADAVLGAAGLGDIGRHFPDTDARFQGADSMRLLGECVRMVWQEGYAVYNVDCTIVAQAPKLAPYRETMRKNLAEMLRIAPENANVKATTTEGLGFCGEGQGMAAFATVTLYKSAETRGEHFA